METTLDVLNILGSYWWIGSGDDWLARQHRDLTKRMDTGAGTSPLFRRLKPGELTAADLDLLRTLERYGPLLRSFEPPTDWESLAAALRRPKSTAPTRRERRREDRANPTR